MKLFNCDSCKHLVYFENVSCLNCEHKLAFIPSIGSLSAFDGAGDRWKALAPAAKKKTFKPCRNGVQYGICNGKVAADDQNPLCVSCRQTEVAPNLSAPGNLDAWRRLEAAKRHLIYSLMMLRLPMSSKVEDRRQGVAYRFLSDALTHEKGPVLTGHDGGVITINIAEADGAERERRRVMLHEPYRTRLGHFRHEIGNYYWDRLVQRSPRLDAFRELFGDERAAYAAALTSHYEHPAPLNWQRQFISVYASSHPWEDWAESWAHYLHMIDALETAAICGVSTKARLKGEPSMKVALGACGMLRYDDRELAGVDVLTQQPKPQPRSR